MRALFMLLLASQGYYQVLAKTQLLFANVTGTGRYARVEAECYNDDYNDAIAWITPPQNNYILSMSDNDLSSIDFNWDKAGWASDFAYKGMFGPIMDYSWETFPIIKTQGAEPKKDKYNFEKLDPIKIFNQFELNFSFLGKSNAQIYMCTGAQVQKSACFIFILGGWEGKGSILRRCKTGTSPIISSDKLDGCENVVEKKEHGSLFSEDNWSHISIRYSNQQLQVIVDDNSLMLFNAVNNSEFNQYERLFIHSYNETALWKYHNYLYHEARSVKNGYIDSNWFHVNSGQLCISFFANFEKETTITLYGYSDNDIPTEIKTFNYEGDKNLQWNYKTFNSSEVENNTYILRINVDEQNIIAIRNVIHQVNCGVTKRNQFHSSILSFDGLPLKTKCTSLREKSAQLVLRQASNRSDTEKQNSLCTTLYNNTVRQHRIICNEEFCYCSMGFHGTYCESACNPGTYGFNCECKCGECKYSTNCNTMSGECPNGCKDNYIGPNCKQRDLPVLNDIAGIQTECISDCEITIYDNNVNYDGVQQPKYYYTQLTHPNGKTNEGEVTSIKSHIIKFTNLLKGHKYTYQIVLCVNNNKRECYAKDIKRFEFETKCEEVSHDQIIIKSADKFTNITVTDYNSETQCDLSQYHWSLKETSRKKEIRSGSLDVNIYWNALNLFTNYSLQLTRNNRITNNISFTTDESIPNAVQNIKAESKSSNTLALIWDEPFPVVGIITNYLVEWKFIGNRDCSIDTKSQDILFRNVTEPKIKLSNLQFYSEYYISIYAFTKKGRSKVAAIIGLTEKDGIKLKAYKYNVYPAKNAVTISLVIDCNNWNGPVSLYITATCKSDWCDGKVINGSKVITYNDMNAKVQNLNPYTNYSVAMYLCADSNNDYLKLGSVDIMTLASVPNPVQFAEVYSSTENSLSLRWSAPYPPTGILDTFILKYKYYKRWNGWSMKQTYTIESCKIWTNMYCTILHNLDNSYEYQISITARNKNVPDEGTPIEFSGLTRISAPQPPLNLQAIWDESHFLHLQWQHPNKTNGPFVRFDVNVSGQRFKHQVSENFTYTVKTSFQCKPEIHHATVSVQTINSKFQSSQLSNTFSCPVFKATFKSEPELRNIDNNTLSIYIPSIENAESNSNLYIILITNLSGKENNCKTGTGFKLDAVIPIQEHENCQIIGHYGQVQYKGIEQTETHVTFTEAPEYNLKTETYELNILIVNEFNGQMSNTLYQVATNVAKKPDDKQNTAGFNFWWLALIFALIALFAAGGFIWYRQPVWLTKFLFSADTSNHIDETKPDLIPLTQQVTTTATTTTTTTPIISRTTTPLIKPPVPAKPSISLIPVSTLNVYVKQASLSGELENQHEKYQRGMLKKADCGKQKENFPKNRYKNLIAYDHSRVILKQINGKPSSDYINANYIKGPTCEKAYIATQGPIDSTIYDFWHMIITEQVEHIIMLANLVETGKQKVSPYWPDFKKINKVNILEDITITATSEKFFYNYVLRTFNVKRGIINTEVTQLHFTNWPDHGVPLYPASLVPFVKAIFNIPHSEKHPILVHCSAGVGRTGTIILIDILLRQAMATNQVDPFHELGKLREQRANLVDNVEQYKLVHLVLLEYFNPYETTHSCEEIEAIYSSLTDNKLKNLLEYIEESAWQESAIFEQPRSFLKADPTKTRDPEIVPGMYGILYLRPRTENDSRYINAVTVDGFNEPKRFISTQHPLPNTIEDFWRLVIDQEIKVVVSLQNEYDVEFWKNGGDLITKGGSLIEHIEEVNHTEFYMHSLDVTLKNEKKHDIKLIELENWGVNDLLPKNLNSLISVWRQVNGIKLLESNILVMCRNGASACGLYIAMTNLLDRMQGEQVVDVCMSVRTTRRSRKQFVNNIEQLRALYRLAVLHLSEFDIYSNFTPITHAPKRA